MVSPESSPESSKAYRLNESCLCETLNQQSLSEALAAELKEVSSSVEAESFWSRSFANQAVFIPPNDLVKMQNVVRAIEKVGSLAEFQEKVLFEVSRVAMHNPGPLGVFMGYDFHLSSTGPRLIEVNTNAGGAFMNAILAKAQSRCCSDEVEVAWTEDFERTVVDMFKNEWRLQGRSDQIRTVAIVDDDPENQYLYPEFRLAAALLERNGIRSKVLGPGELTFAEGRVWHGSEPIDLIYNRLVDFALEEPAHQVLQRAWLQDAAVITPHPRAHALLANKKNLTLLSDSRFMQSSRLDAEYISLLLETVPRTSLVTGQNAKELWENRRGLFFKPLAGYGSKGSYRGSKLTKGTFEKLLDGRHIAQELIPPSERAVKVDGQEQHLKVDVRLYTYSGELILPAARLYRGQTTNFRTPGGGFAPVLIA